MSDALRTKNLKILQANIYDLQSLSATLKTHEIFLKELEQIVVLLRDVGEDDLAADYEQQFLGLSHDYEQLGKPTHLRDKFDREYFARARQLSDDLVCYIETFHPIKFE